MEGADLWDRGIVRAIRVGLDNKVPKWGIRKYFIYSIENNCISSLNTIKARCVLKPSWPT